MSDALRKQLEADVLELVREWTQIDGRLVLRGRDLEDFRDQLADVISGRSSTADELQTYGMCTACGSVEVALNCVTGYRDLSRIGEHPRYPTGYGCEVCS